jgi:glycosyltransferase involved in cell wall biosynthesis
MPLTVLNVGYPLAPVSHNTAGGAEQVLALLDDALVNAGHRSIVIAPEGSECRGLLIATPAFTSPLNEEKAAFAWAEQRRAIRTALSEFAVDLIHFHGVDYYRYLPSTDIPVLVTLHLPLSWYPAEVLCNAGINTHLVCVSNSQARRRPAGAEIRAIVENGVPLPNLRVEKRGDYVVALGRICPEKGFHLAIDAASKAGLPLVLAGTVFGYSTHQQYWDTEVKPRLRTPHVFVGAVGPRKKQQLLASARCLVVTSLVEETSSLVAMEAMACGTPVVALRRGALAQIVDHGRTGFLVDSAEQLADAILAATQLSTKACRQRAEKLFSAECMTTRYLSLYSQLASERSLADCISETFAQRVA